MVVTIKLNSDQLQAIYSHAESTYPEECCGLLLGNINGASKTLVEVRPTNNVWSADSMENFQAIAPTASMNSLKRDHYTIAPEEILKAQKDARDRNLNIIGIFHSHPDHAAIPSEMDRAIAWSQYSYLIVSVQQGKACDLKSWCLDANHQFQSETIETL